MAQTVIGIFDNSSEAQQAVQELKRIGISDSNIDVSSSSSSSSSSGSSYDSSSSSSDSTFGSSSSSSSSSSHGDGIGGFFRSLFSDDDDSANRYSNVARHSDCIVTVHAQSQEEARRAAIILDQYGSVDVDQRANEYGYGSTSGSSYSGGSGSTYGSSTTGASFGSGTDSSYGSGTGSTYGSGSGMSGSGSSLTGGSDSTLGSGAGTTSGSYASGSDSSTLGTGTTSGSSYTSGSDSSTLGTGTGSGTFGGGADSTYTGSTNNTALSDSTSDYTGSTTGHTHNDLNDSTSIPIIEENLQVGKREVETGGARLRSRIVERPVEEHLRLRTEHVRVERTPVNRPATEADFTSFREGEIEMTEHAEVPIVNKEARVVEEVSLGKEIEERDEVVRDTVRSTEVDVDNLTGSDTSRTGLDTDLTNDRTGTGTGLDSDLDRDRTHRGLTDLDNDRNTAI